MSVKFSIDDYTTQIIKQWNKDTGNGGKLLATTLVPLPQPAGEYVIGEGYYELHLPIDKKPTWVKRIFCKFLLGWKWKNRIPSLKVADIK